MPSSHVLFLPGLMCDRRLFAAQSAALDIESSVADLTRHDNFPDMADAVLGEAPPLFALVGLSMGGILAFEIWRQAPDRVTHLGLLDTTPYADTPEKKDMRLEQVRIAAQGGLRQLAIDSLKPVYLAASRRDDETLLGEILDMAIDNGPDVFARQSAALRNRADSIDTLSTINRPTLVLCGGEDALCPPRLHEIMAQQIPDATLTVVSDCGHMATMERPQIVNEALRRLLAA